MTEDEMVGWHHPLDGHESEQAPGVGDGQGGLACSSNHGIFQASVLEWGAIAFSAPYARPVLNDSVTPWTAARQASLSITNSWSLLRLMSIESVMPSNHLLLCCHLLLPPSIFPSIRVFSNESVLCIRWPKVLYSFNFPSKE